ncbi:MAG: PP0621 family protein [Blastocatellia bacterium]
MILRFLFYSFIAYVALRLIRWLFTPSRQKQTVRTRGARQRGAAQMVRCDACGMFITKNSALMAGERDFCSKICLEQKVHSA